MSGHTLPGFFLTAVLCCLGVLLFSSALSAEIIPNPLARTSTGDVVPIYDAVQYQSQESVEKEMIENGMTLYLKRPYGYVQTTADTGANLSIVKTEILRYSESRAVIKGEIKNLEDRMIDLIVITFNLYNADGDQIGNAYASIDYLSPKATWKFVTDPIERSDFQFERYGSIFVGAFE